MSAWVCSDGKQQHLLRDRVGAGQREGVELAEVGDVKLEQDFSGAGEGRIVSPLWMSSVRDLAQSPRWKCQVSSGIGLFKQQSLGQYPFTQVKREMKARVRNG